MADMIYDDSICDKTVQILSDGKSIAYLATKLGVCRETIYEWRDKHPEYAKALRRGRDAGQAYWEDIGEAGITGQIERFGGASWIFTMKNRFREDYKEDKEAKPMSETIVEKLIDRLVD